MSNSEKLENIKLHAALGGIMVSALAIMVVAMTILCNKIDTALAESTTEMTTEVLTEATTEATTEVQERVITVLVEKEPETDLTDEQKDLLARVVHAEAGNQDPIGKRLVVDVVLNRMYCSDFPNDLEGVVYQTNQFANPAFSYTESDMEAVEKELQERLDRSVLWFRTGSYHTHGTALYRHGAHYFSGEVYAE